VFESFVASGRVKQIGISNCYDPDFFKYLFEQSKVKPSVLQNRFYEASGYDRELRDFCNDQGVYYQCFWTVNANPHIWQDPYLVELAEKLNKSALQVYFRALIYDNIHPLFGTTNNGHMEEVMDLLKFSLDTAAVQKISSIYKTSFK
jgi:diketogulonate reductase-like aldo/keto reductase